MTATFLKLTNRVLKAFNEVQLNEANFASAEGFYQEAKDDVVQAIFDIYTMEDIAWPFAWNTGTVTTTIGEQNYTKNVLATGVNWESFRIESNVVNNIFPDFIPSMPYQTYLANYWQRDAEVRDNAGGYSKPTQVVRRPDNNIILTPVPDLVYTITYEYYKLPVALENPTDISSIPEEFSQVIIDKALHYAYMFRDNIEEASVAQDRYEKNVYKMRRILIPPFDNIIPR